MDYHKNQYLTSIRDLLQNFGEKKLVHFKEIEFINCILSKNFCGQSIKNGWIYLNDVKMLYFIYSKR